MRILKFCFLLLVFYFAPTVFAQASYSGCAQGAAIGGSSPGSYSGGQGGTLGGPCGQLASSLNGSNWISVNEPQLSAITSLNINLPTFPNGFSPCPQCVVTAVLVYVDGDGSVYIVGTDQPVGSTAFTQTLAQAFSGGSFAPDSNALYCRFSSGQTGCSASIAATSAGLNGGTTYDIGVFLFSSGSFSLASQYSPLDWTATAPAPPPITPPTPAGLTATPGNGQVTLTWNPSTGATYYYVLSGTSLSNLTATLTTATSFIDSPLTNGTLYYFEVQAGATGVSPPSAPVTATPEPQTPMQVLIYTTYESAPNAVPISYLPNGTPINCPTNSGPGGPDDPSSIDTGRIGTIGDCFEPLALAFNAIVPVTYRANGNYCQDNDAWTALATSLPGTIDGETYTDISRLTTSMDSFDGQNNSASVTSISLTCGFQAYTVLVTNVDGSTFTFVTSQVGADPINTAFTSLGDLYNGGNDSGTAVMYTQIQPPSGTYPGGSFDNNFDAEGNTLTQDSTAIISFGAPTLTLDFQIITPITVNWTATTGTPVCWLPNGASLSSTNQGAVPSGLNGPSYVSGDTASTPVSTSDGQTIVYLYFSPGSDANDIFGTGTEPDSIGTEFVAYQVIASPVANCAGSSGYDAAFHRAIGGRRPTWGVPYHPPAPKPRPIEWHVVRMNSLRAFVMSKHAEPNSESVLRLLNGDAIRPIVRDLPLEER